MGQAVVHHQAINDTIATLAGRSRTAQANAHFRQAEQYFSDTELKQATISLNQAIALKHDFQEALLLRARVYQRESRFAESLTDYQSLLFLNPTQVEARFEKAQLLYRLERYEKAIEDFRFILEHDLGETTTVYFRGSTQTDDQGNTSFSTQSIGTVQSGMKADIWNLMGLSYLKLKNYTKALLYLELALSQNRQDAAIYNNLGIVSEQMGDTLQAIDYYRQAVVIQPDHEEALQNFSFLTQKSGNTQVATSTFAQISERASPSTLLHEGMALIKADNYKEAIMKFDQGLRQSPQSPDLLLQRGFAQEKLAQLELALADYTQAINLNSTLEQGYLNRGNVYYKLKKFGEAERDYLSAIKLYSSNPKAYYNLGLVYHRKKQLADACRCLGQAVNLGYSPAQEVINKVCRSQ